MTKNKPHILYVEDDVFLSFVTKDNLELKGYSITFCKNGMEALEVFQKNTFDLCILDVMMPEMDGYTVARKIREVNEHIPILFLSAKSLKEDRITGLMAGGDDYITKPFSIEELCLKIEVFLKRSRVTGINKLNRGEIRLGGYLFDTFNLQLKHEKVTYRLTTRESELLKYLAENRNKVLKKEDILNEVWGDDSYFNSRSLDVFVSKLRKYVKEDTTIQINNVHGIGFVLAITE
jgi:two-component system, OmpR family, response regulator VicR